jgi:site-specific DNA-methyltransferase (adenine-specific)
MNNTLMFSKASDEWATPQATFDALNAEFGFEKDCAASEANTKVPGFWLGPDCGVNALEYRWGPCVCWLNPPYSMCREFIAKAAAEAALGATVVCLVPSRTDTRWWHEHVWDREQHGPRPGVEVRFLKGRLRFGGATAGAPFPSVVLVFRCPVAQPLQKG